MSEQTPALEALARIAAHIEICSVRYASILARVDRLERVIIGAAASVIVGLAGILGTLLCRLPAVHP